MGDMTDNSNKNDYQFNSEEMTVTIHLESGSVDCTIIVILSVEDNDYIVLLPIDEDGDSEEGEVWFYRYIEDENDVLAEPVLTYIDSDEEFESVSRSFQEFLDNSEYDELYEEDDLLD